MQKLVGFTVKGQEYKVCQLFKSIYELKQSSRQWYLKFHQAITFVNFVIIDKDHCVYVYKIGDCYAILSLYMDDILLVANNINFLTTIKKWLSSNFEMKDMGEAAYILGVKISRDQFKKFLAHL